MNITSRTTAGRSRSADADAFLRPNVVHTTEYDPSGPSIASPHAWKRVLQERVWSPHGPKGMTARSVLMLLIWHGDASGRAWLGVQTIANKTGAGSLRTVRHAIDALVREGWLRCTPQTWASLTAEQVAAGRPVPRRDDVGQAPNLYVLLDGRGHSATSEVAPPRGATRPGLARIAKESKRRDVPTPGHIDLGRLGPLEPGQPGADPHRDLDPKGSRSRIERVERATRDTHGFAKVRPKEPGWSKAWQVLVDAHTDKTNKVYGLPPLPPDLHRHQRQALGECLDGAAAEVRAKLQARTGIERDGEQVQRELATRVMQLYFKRDNEHLRRVKHALRDLPREFHARITEAMQMLLRESNDATKPRAVQVAPVVVKTNDAVATPPSRPNHNAQLVTAREARRLLETLGSAGSREERAAPPTSETPQPLLARPDHLAAGREERTLSEPDKPSVPDKPTSARVGAPRWGNLGPRTLKVRTFVHVAVDEHARQSPARHR